MNGRRMAIAVAAVVFLVQLAYVDRWTPWTGLAILAAVILFFNGRRSRTTGESFYSTSNLFWGVLFMYLSNFRWHGSDDLPTALLPFSLLRDHTFSLDRYLSWFNPGHMDNIFSSAHGHWVSLYPVIGALLSLPVYLLPVLRGVEPTDHVLHQLEKISASLICAAAVGVLFTLYRRRMPDRWAFALALVYALGTDMFSLCSQGLWQYGASVLMVMLTLWAMDRAEEDARRWAVCGAFAVLAMAARSPSLFYVGAFLAIACLKGGWKGMRYYILGGLIPGLLLLSYWTWIVGTGRPAEFSVQMHLFHFPPALSAIAGYLISPGRGILFFSPIILFAGWGFWRALIHPSRSVRLQALPLGVCMAGLMVLFTSYGAWNGGFSFGSRYLIELETVLFYFLPNVAEEIRYRPRVRRLWWTAAFVAITCNAIGAYATWNWEEIVLKRSVWELRAYPPIYVMTEGWI